MRLQVLLRQDLKAVRIDESAMVLYALTGKGEARLELHANCRDESYLRQVREMFSTHVLGSPGGYPIFLKRWTRMGQTRDESLHSLLLLAEPEAVVAVAHAKGLNEELARRTWWAMPTADVARRMLENESVAQSQFGKELAGFLLEFLPFDEDPNAMIESVRLVLRPGLISGQERDALWRKAGRKTAMYVGFLLAAAENLPQSDAAGLRVNSALQILSQQLPDGHVVAQVLKRQSELSGQVFLDTVITVLTKMANQDVALQLFKAIQRFFNPGALVTQNLPRELVIVEELAQRYCDELLGQYNFLTDIDMSNVRAMIRLAHISEQLLNPIFAQTDAVGTVMRKRLQSLSEYIVENISQLQGKR